MVGSTSYVAVDLNALGQRSGRRRRSRTPYRRLVTNHQTATSTSTTAVNVKGQVDVHRTLGAAEAMPQPFDRLHSELSPSRCAAGMHRPRSRCTFEAVAELTTDRRWKTFADVVAFALGTNVW